MIGNKQDRSWVKPEMVRIGRISDVALGTNVDVIQCTGGSATCAAPARTLS